MYIANGKFYTFRHHVATISTWKNVYLTAIYFVLLSNSRFLLALLAVKYEHRSEIIRSLLAASHGKFVYWCQITDMISGRKFPPPPEMIATRKRKTLGDETLRDNSYFIHQDAREKKSKKLERLRHQNKRKIRFYFNCGGDKLENFTAVGQTSRMEKKDHLAQKEGKVAFQGYGRQILEKFYGKCQVLQPINIYRHSYEENVSKFSAIA